MWRLLLYILYIDFLFAKNLYCPFYKINYLNLTSKIIIKTKNTENYRNEKVCILNNRFIFNIHTHKKKKIKVKQLKGYGENMVQ